MLLSLAKLQSCDNSAQFQSQLVELASYDPEHIKEEEEEMKRQPLPQKFMTSSRLQAQD